MTPSISGYPFPGRQQKRAHERGKPETVAGHGAVTGPQEMRCRPAHRPLQCKRRVPLLCGAACAPACTSLPVYFLSYGYNPLLFLMVLRLYTAPRLHSRRRCPFFWIRNAPLKFVRLRYRLHIHTSERYNGPVLHLDAQSVCCAGYVTICTCYLACEHGTGDCTCSKAQWSLRRSVTNLCRGLQSFEEGEGRE